MDAEKIGKVILELRKHHKLTQLQLAEKLYVSDKAISKIETMNVEDLKKYLIELVRDKVDLGLEILNGGK